MKKTKYIIILLLLLSLKMNAEQQYKPCLDDNFVKWSILVEVYDWPYYSEEIIAYGDTVINEIAYKNIFNSYFSDFEETNVLWKNYIPDLSGLDSDLHIRESDDASKLYILNSFSGEEYLISDLNLEVGDEFQIPEIWRGFIQEYSVTVDSVYTKNELKHIQFNLTVFYNYEMNEELEYKLTFIEGVGPNTGPVSMTYLFQVLNCFQNQSLFLKNGPELCPCGYRGEGGAINTIYSKEDYIIQKEDNCIKLHFLANANGQISIHDISGRLHCKLNFYSGEDVTVPTTSFPKGIYLLKIFSKNNNQINIHKIIL
jgi:hypothetical protein